MLRIANPLPAGRIFLVVRHPVTHNMLCRSLASAAIRGGRARLTVFRFAIRRFFDHPPLLPRAAGRPAGARRPVQRREAPTSTREQAEAVTAPYATSTPRVSASVAAANMPNPSEANTTDRM